MQAAPEPISDLPVPIGSGRSPDWGDVARQAFAASNFEATDTDIARAAKTLARLSSAAGQAMHARAGAADGPSFTDTLLALSHV